MFESDDWDLDQDLLKDVDEKASQFYSQIDNEKIEPKRRKTEAFEDSIFSSYDDTDWNEKITKDNVIGKQNYDNVSRKNLILGMFNKNKLHENVPKVVLGDLKDTLENHVVETHSNSTIDSQGSQLPRKNLVLDILKKKNVPDRGVENNAKISESKIESKSKANAQDSTLLYKKTEEQSLINNSKVKNISSNDNLKQSSPGNSRKKLLCNILKQPCKNNAEQINDIVKANNSFIKPPQVQSNKKVSLIRKFPGPAGLLPDDIDANFPSVAYLNSLEEKEKIKDPNESDLSEYCSQNTKKMFTEGAWQIMLDDLPNDFLKGHDIASIKQIVKSNGYSSTKAEFLAGLIVHIDHSHDNPPIILKDFTDSIQGIVHKDIPLKYPGLLEQNVVILLHDVGLLRTSGNLVSNKYQILISPSSLLAIYSSKGHIQHTCFMESILGNLSDKGIEKKTHNLKISSGNNFPKTTCSKSKTETGQEIGFNMRSNETSSSMNESMNFDIINDFSFAISSDDITNSQHCKNFNTPVSQNLKHANKEKKPQSSKKCLKQLHENLQNSSKQQSKALFKTLDKFRPNIDDMENLSHKQKLNVDHPVPTNIYSNKAENKILNNLSSEELNIEEMRVSVLPDQTECAAENLPTFASGKTESVHINNVKEKRFSIRAKLLQFKCADDLTPPENFESTTSLNTEKYENDKDKSCTNSFADTLCSISNDSDDEILSQLDMDTIFSNYTNKN